MRNLTTIVLIAAISLAIITCSYCNATKVEFIKNYKVIRLVKEKEIHGSKAQIITTFKYIVVTDKETFLCENSFYNSKYDNANTFYHLQEGKCYDFKVSGYGKSFFFTYRNILEAKSK